MGNGRFQLATDHGQPNERRALLREVLLATAGATALCVLLARVQEFVPLVRANLYVLVAAVFLYLPVPLLRRRGLSTWDVGLTTRPRVRGLLFALGAIVVVFPPYLAGFHGWQRWMFGNSPQFSTDAYRRWPAEWEGRPGRGIQPEGLQLWTEGNELRLRWGTPPDARQPLRIALEAAPAGQIELQESGGAAPQVPGPGKLTLRARRAGEARLRIHGGETLTVTPALGERALSPAQLRLGAGSAEAPSVPLTGERSLGWIVLLVLSHLLLVALPEELFYRGYAQTTLDRVWRGRLRVLGVELGPSVLVVSVLFALGHFAVDLHVQRLAVFFPSLLFGWLRAGSGSLLAPVLFHAASNVYADLLGKGYLP